MSSSRVLLDGACVLLLLATGAAAQSAPPGGKTDYAGEDAIVERQARSGRFEDDGTAEYTTTTRVRLLTEGGVRQWGLLRLAYDTEAQVAEFRDLRVTKAGGEVATPSLAQIQEVTAPVAQSAPMYSSYREKQFAVPDLHPGDTLEFTAVVSVRKPLAPGQFWCGLSFYHDAIALDERLEIDVPRARTLHLRTNTGVTPVVSEEGDRRVYRFTHSMTDLAEVAKNRKLSARHRRGYPDVSLSSFKAWEEFGTWYAGLERERRAPTPEIRAKAVELTRGLTTEVAKTQALYGFVSRTIRYVSLALGMASVQPHAAAQTLANGYGDCKDKHTLLAALLASVGVRAYAVLVHTDQPLDEAVPYLQFDHLITAVPEGKDMLWLDTTAEVGPFRWLAPTLRDRQVLVVPPDGRAYLAKTPAEPMIANESAIEVEGHVDDSGTLFAQQVSTLRGDPGVFFNAVFRRVPRNQWPQALEKAVTSMAEGMNLKAQIQGVTPQDSPSQPEVFSWKTDFSIAHISEPGSSASASFLSLPRWIDRLASADDLHFTLDGQLAVPGPAITRVRAKIELPPDWVLLPPVPTVASQDFAEFASSYRLDGHTLIVERTLKVKTDKLPETRADAYEQFRSQLSKDTHVLTFHRAADVAKQDAVGEAERLYSAGSAANKKQDYKAAVESLKQAVALAPDHKDAWDELGFAYFRLRDDDRAVSALLTQIKITPTHKWAHRHLGLAYKQAHKYPEALAAFQKQLEINPQDEFAHWNLGLISVDDKKPAEGVVEIEKAAAIAPKNADIQISLGGVYLILDEDEKALAAYDRAVTVAPQPRTWNNAAYGLAEAGRRLDRGQEWAESAVTSMAARLRTVAPERLDTPDVEASRDLAMYWDTLGWIRFKRKDLEGALRCLEAAFALRPVSATADHLGQVQEARGEKEKAARAYTLALALWKDRPGGRARLAALVEEGTIDDRVEKAKADLPELGAASVPRPAGVEGSLSVEIFVALGTNGTIVAARAAQPAPPADAAARALVGTRHSLVFPDATPTQAVRRATLACPAAGDCRLSFPQARGAAAASASSPSTEAPPSTGIVHVGGDIVPPRKLKNVSPDYPAAAKDARVQGIVVLECTIDKEGKVIDVRVMSGEPQLVDAASEAVRQWVYTPTLLKGEAVPVIMTVTVNFRLN